MQVQDKEKLAGLDVFEGLSAGQFESILACASEDSFQEGEIVIKESSLTSDLYVLLEGRVSVEIDFSAGKTTQREQIVRLRAGDVFGEIAFLKGKRRSAYVVAMDNIRVLRIDGDRARELFEQDKTLGYQVTRNLALIVSQRLIDTNFKWRQDMGRIG